MQAHRLVTPVPLLIVYDIQALRTEDVDGLLAAHELAAKDFLALQVLPTNGLG